MPIESVGLMGVSMPHNFAVSATFWAPTMSTIRTAGMLRLAASALRSVMTPRYERS
jgi:hypothetical protein